MRLGWVPWVTHEQVVVEEFDGCTCWGACEPGGPWACVGPILWCLGRWGNRWAPVGQCSQGTGGKLVLLDRSQ